MDVIHPSDPVRPWIVVTELLKGVTTMARLVRGFALALILTGLFAATRPQASPASQASVVKPTNMPVPVCPPNDPNACHIEQW